MTITGNRGRSMSRFLPIIALALHCGGITASAQAQGDFVRVGDMVTARYWHTATLLPEGRVLIAGGTESTYAELYDPAARVFTTISEMTTARRGHTATLLHDGRVLIAGGSDGSGRLLASAELYDPSTGTFSATGSMSTGQVGHTATLLANGKVLIAGGLRWEVLGWPVAAAPELYDPSTGEFAAAGDYASDNPLYPSAGGPIWPTATALPDARVLFVGNNPAELYDPVTDTFSATGALTSPEYKYGTYWHTATLLSNERVLIAGGTDDLVDLDDAEIYDPASGTFTATSRMTARRSLHTATLLANGTVLITGGETWLTDGSSGWWGGVVDTSELYDPPAGMFAAAARMSVPRAAHTATLLHDGTVLVTGGTSESAELYVPSMDDGGSNGGPIETITVPVDGSTVISNTVLEIGRRYVLRASGTFVIGGPGDGLADAEYFDFSNPPDSIGDLCLYDPSCDYGLAINDDFVSDGKSTHWGAFTPPHVYTIDFTGEGAPIRFTYHDTYYDGNVGSLTVEIFDAETPP